jgi:hypothetical protein
MTLTRNAAFGIAGVTTMITSPVLEVAVHIAPRSVLGMALDLAMWAGLFVGLSVLFGDRT